MRRSSLSGDNELHLGTPGHVTPAPRQAQVEALDQVLGSEFPLELHERTTITCVNSSICLGSSLRGACRV